MNFTKILKTRQDEIQKCEESIKELEKIYGESIYLDDRNALIETLKEKIKMLRNISIQNTDTISQDLQSINEKIYNQYLIFRQIVIEKNDLLKQNKKSYRALNEIFKIYNYLKQEKEIIDWFKNQIFNALKHPVLLSFLAYIIGIAILMRYFHTNYIPFPNFDSKDLLFYATITSAYVAILVVIITCLLTLLTSIAKKLLVKTHSTPFELIRISLLSLSPLIIFSLNLASKSNSLSLSIYFALLFIFELITQKYYLLKSLKASLFEFIISLPSILFTLIAINSSGLISPFDLSLCIIFGGILIYIFFLRQVPPAVFTVSLSVLTICLFFLLAPQTFELVVRFIGLSYTPEVMILESVAKEVIPDKVLKSMIKNKTITIAKESIKIQSPKVLSNMGNDYYLEILVGQKLYHFTVPKKLVLSQQFKTRDNEEALQENK